MKSSKCPSMFSEDEPANIKLLAESISGWEPLKEAQTAHWTVLDCVLQMTASELCSSAMSKDFTLSPQGHYSHPTDQDESLWNLWWLRAVPKAFTKLCRIGKISTKTHVPKAFPPHLCSIPSQNGDKTIMTQLAATQLSHCSIMSENEIDLKILRRPGLEQKGLLCWLY